METKNILLSSSLLCAVLLLNSCSTPTYVKCFPGAEKMGYYCYKDNIYGKNLSADYKKGIHDGCSTGEGHFVRDYSLSAVSKDYRDGWDSGRSKCHLITPEDAKPGIRTQYQQDIDQKKHRS